MMKKNQDTFKELDLYAQDYAFRVLIQDVNWWVIKLDPVFQRKYKRDHDGYERCSRFIESCLMRIPLPSCYFRELSDWSFEVIDWVQRITTIKDYIENKFALEWLSVIPELNGKRFNELESIHQTDLKNYSIRGIFLRRTNPDNIVYEIFARLNQGAVQLSQQEIRKAIYYWNMYKLLEELAQETIIKKLAWTKISELQDHELVLRFFAMSDDLDWYNDRMHDYLNNFMIRNQSINEKQIEEFRQLFHKTLKKAKDSLWENLFANHNNQRLKTSGVIYDLVMRYCKNHEIIPSNFKDCLWKVYDDEEYKKSTSGWTLQKSNIIKRRKMLLDYIKN